MVKKCMYCHSEISSDSVMDVCNPCGYQVWGGKMFSAIVKNMENARESGNLFQGSVSDSASQVSERSPKFKSSELVRGSKKLSNPLAGLAQEALHAKSLIQESQELQGEDSFSL